MVRLLGAMFLVFGGAVFLFLLLCLVPSLIPIAPLIVIVFLIWIVYKLIGGR